MERVQDLPNDTWITDRQRALGDRLRAARERQNLTQDAVWLAAGISRYTLQRAERGEDVRMSTLLRIMRVLNLSLGDLD